MRRALAMIGALALVAGCSGGKGGGSSSSSSSPGDSTAAQAADNSQPGRPGPAAQSAGDPTQAAYTPTGPLIADDGFRPDKNGFSFENYGNTPDSGGPPYTDLTPADVETLFGPAVCSSGTGDMCQLVPGAKAWMDTTNNDMDGGHCYGMAVLSDLIYRGTVKPEPLGGPNASAMALDGNTPLQRQIALDWAYQNLDAVTASEFTGTPNDIVAKLTQVLVPNPKETYTLSIYQRNGDGGHEMTPYAVEDAGGGIDNILVYDNNFPGVTRAVRVDTNADTWHYIGGTDPSDTSEVYEGDATTQTLTLFPDSVGLGQHPCPFCNKVGQGVVGATQTSEAPTPSADVDQIYLESSDTDHAHLLITDPSGHRLGYVGGTLVNEISGATVIRSRSTRSWSVGPEPRYSVPDGVHYVITLDATGMQAADNETVGVIGPDFTLTASDINVQPGETDTLGVDPSATKVTYQADRTETPVLELAVSDDTADYTFDVSGQSDANSMVTLGLPLDGTSLLINPGTTSGSSTFDLSMIRDDDNGSQEFDHNDLDLGAGDSAELPYGNWSQGHPIPLVVHHPDGSTDTQQIADQDITNQN